MWEFMVKTANDFWAGADAAWEIIKVLGTWVLMMYPIIILAFFAIMLVLFFYFKAEEYIEERKKKHGQEK